MQVTIDADVSSYDSQLPDGRYVEIKNKEDQDYFINELRNVLGDAANLFSFSKNGLLKVDKKEAKNLKDGAVKDIINGFQELASNRDFGVEFTTKVGEDGKYAWNPTQFVEETSKDEDGVSVSTMKEIYVFGGGKGIIFDLTKKGEGIFASLNESKDPRIVDKNAIVIMSRERSAKGTFSAGSGISTEPCAGCIIIHEFLDHALPWQNSLKTDDVKYQNAALILIKSPTRDGKDH